MKRFYKVDTAENTTEKSTSETESQKTNNSPTSNLEKFCQVIAGLEKNSAFFEENIASAFPDVTLAQVCTRFNSLMVDDLPRTSSAPGPFSLNLPSQEQANDKDKLRNSK